jgi:CBS domain-containing protein
MAVAGVFVSPFLLLIALFVWMGAGAEARAVEAAALLRGQPVSAAMLRMFTVVGEGTTIEQAAGEMLAGSPRDFAVTRGGTRDEPVVGVLTRDDLAAAVQAHPPETPVGEVMRPAPPPVSESEPLEAALEKLQGSGSPLLPVVDGFGRVVGMLTIDNVGQLLRLRAAAMGRPGGGAPRSSA